MFPFTLQLTFSLFFFYFLLQLYDMHWLSGETPQLFHRRGSIEKASLLCILKLVILTISWRVSWKTDGLICWYYSSTFYQLQLLLMYIVLPLYNFWLRQLSFRASVYFCTSPLQKPINFGLHWEKMSFPNAN